MKPKEQKIDFILFLLVSALILIGSIMVYSSSSVIAEANKKLANHAFFLKRQLIWLMLAYLLMLATTRINLDRLRPFTVWGLGISFVLLVAVFVGSETRDTHRWLHIWIFNLQPSEIFKYALVFYLAHSLSQKGRNLDDAKQYLWPYGPIIGLGALLIVMEPDLGPVLVLGGTVIFLFFLAGARVYHLLIALGGSAISVYVIVFIIGYKRARVDSYLASLSDPMEAAYQVKQAILSLANGGLLGVGLGNGIFKQFFLPEPHTDFIFASIGEELGFIGLLVTLSLLLGVIWRGMKISVAQPDRFRFLLASGVTICLAINIVINVAVVLGLIPTTGLTLPFLSYGGSSLVVSAIAVGVLLNLSRLPARYSR